MVSNLVSGVIILLDKSVKPGDVISLGETFGWIGQSAGVPMHAQGDLAEPPGPVVDRVHGGGDGEQHLRRADVRGGLLAPDVLFARLQGQAVGGRAVGVDRDAHESPG